MHLLHDATGGTALAIEEIPPRPVPIEPIVDGISEELRELPRWVCWKYEWREGAKGGAGKYTKVPKRFGRTNASSTKPETWTTFGKAYDVFDRSRDLLDGIGFVFADSVDDIMGIDLDNARDPETGEPLEWAQPIIDHFWGTYMEVSPSGKGFKIFTRGKMPGDGGRKTPYGGGEVEMYSSGRYFTVTGHRYGERTALLDTQESVEWLYREVYGKADEEKRAKRGKRNGKGSREIKKRGRSSEAAAIVLAAQGFDGEDTELLEKAFAAKNGGKLKRVFEGDCSGYKSQSEAEMALANMLAFWSGPDPIRLESLMRQSALVRDKWDTQRGSSTYIADTVANALDGQTKFYSPVSREHADEIDAVPEARALLDVHGRDDQGRLTLRYHRQDFYQHVGRRYSVRSIDDIRAAVVPWLDERYFKLTRSTVANVVAMLQAECHIPSTTDSPVWLGEGPRYPNLIAVHNGLLDIEAAVAGADSPLRPHTPEWFSTVCLAYSYDPKARCPLWERMLLRNLSGDLERIALLQEFIGLCLSRSTDFQKFLMLLGEGGTGKSSVLAGIIALLGMPNISSVALERFGERFALFQMLGKLANVCAEIGETDKVAEGILKALTSGDPHEFERKGRDCITAVPTARLVFSTNNFPRFTDRTGGIWRRLILVPFNEVIPDHEKVVGMDKPEWWQQQGELPGLLNWAIEGLRRLRQQGRFTESAVVKTTVAEYRQESNPAAIFLQDHYRENEHGLEPKSEVYERYQQWCAKTSHRPLTDANFAREVSRQFPRVTQERPRVGGKPVRCWVGITRGAEVDED